MPTVELDHRLVNTEVLPRFVNLSKPRVGEVDHVPDLVKWIISRLGAVSYHRGIIYNVDITIQSPVTVPRHNSGQITVPEIFLGTPDVVHLFDTLQPRSNVHTYVCTHFRDVSLGPWVAMCRAGASGCCTYGCCPDTGSIGVGMQHHGFKKSQIKKKKKVIQRRSSWRKPMDRPHKILNKLISLNRIQNIRPFLPRNQIIIIFIIPVGTCIIQSLFIIITSIATPLLPLRTLGGGPHRLQDWRMQVRGTTRR